MRAFLPGSHPLRDLLKMAPARCGKRCLLLLHLLFSVSVSQDSGTGSSTAPTITEPSPTSTTSTTTTPTTTAPTSTTPPTTELSTTEPAAITEIPTATTQAPSTTEPAATTETPPATTASATTTPTTTTPSTTTPATTAPAPTTRAPTPTTTAPSPITTAPSPITTAPFPTTTAPAPTTEAPAPITTAPSPITTTEPSTTTPTTSAPTATTVAPVVEYYNSSTLPPGVDSSMLGGADLVNVKVTETTLENGTTSYSYVIITRSDGTEKAIVVNPTTNSASASGNNNNATQSGSSLSDSNNATKSSSSISFGAIVGIIVAAVVFMLVLFAFFIAQRRRNKERPSGASSDDVLESPVLIGKQTRLLEQGRSPADTEYQEITRTTAYSPSSASMPDSRRHRSTLWEDPVILASRIPIDRVKLGDVISRGGFGEVYRGRYRDQDVAVKTLLPENRKDLAHIQAFLSEVRLMATMEHPHIVQFIGVAWESLSDLFCVTEFMAGGDLRSLLKDYLATGVPQGMDASKMQIAYQVAYALTYLHSLDPVVLHRDLKSRNILLTESLNAKITDFGASRIRSDATMTAGVGSSLWMAPEVMMGMRYGEKADVFSLGVVISELDTHELPYSHAKESNSGSSGRPLPDTAVMQMVSMGTLRVRFSQFMDPDMTRFMDSCVSVDPQARPTAAEVLYYLQVAIRKYYQAGIWNL